MSDTPTIRCDGVWKKFRRGEVHDSLRDLVPNLVRRALKRATLQAEDLRGDEFWALSDVTFTVDPGQALGIIGPNGAGKSTILKVLSRILRPTRGTYLVRGRVGSLIEVAAGFHPDLTGRENIFLLGAIMGMSNLQVRQKMDAIIAFSEIEAFIDTPVKRYSSGMNARLGFSIAAHLDPDVLIIDEVLAVGDYAFQRKAFAHIRTLAKSGMPVVVVSHQLDRVAELCTHALLLSRGRSVVTGTPTEVIGSYLRETSTAGHTAATESPLVLETATVTDGNEITSGHVFRFVIEGHVRSEITKHIEPVVIFVRSAQTGDIVSTTGSSVFGLELGQGPFSISVELQLNVQPGLYLIDMGCWDRADERQLMVGPTLTVRVLEGKIFLGHVNCNPVMQLGAVPLPLSKGA